MEIEFINVLIDNFNNLKSLLNLKIEEGSITGICTGGKNEKILSSLIGLEFIKEGNIKLKSQSKELIITNKKYPKDVNKIIGYLPHDAKEYLFFKKIQNEFKGVTRKRLSQAFKIIGLDVSYLFRSKEELASSILRKILLAKVLINNPKVILIDDFEKGLTVKETKSFLLLLKNLNKKYNKTIILMTDNSLILRDLCSKIVILNNGVKILEGDKKIFLDDKVYEFIQMPKITSFIRKIKTKQNIKLEDYVEVKELIKGIYREVR